MNNRSDRTGKDSPCAQSAEPLFFLGYLAHSATGAR